MSYNQSRFDKSDSAQYRKSGRSASFNHPRASSGAYAKGGAPAPSPSLSSGAASRSFRKPGNAQGVQPRVNFPSANPHLVSSNSPSAPLHNLHNASAHSSTRDVPSATSKPAETTPAPPRGIQTVPETPTSQPTSMNSDTTAPSTPVKASGDASKAFAFQFGSLSPGLVNGMQVPARISSAPPNIDEQKRDKAHHDSVKSVHPIPIPPAARPHLPGKDMGPTNHSSAADVPKAKKDTLGQPVTLTQAQKAHVNQVSRISMPMTYHQPQFTAPNPQIQSHGMPPTSIQMQMQVPMALPMASAPPQVQQQMFVPGLQPHQLPPLGALHQSQGLSFPQPPPQMANLGAGTGQYTQQQGQLAVPRRTPVKITHPDTHQEVKLDKPSDAVLDAGPSSRPTPNMPPQSQLVTSYSPGHQYNYYHTYNPGTMFFPGPGSLPVPGAQITPASQALRYNYPVSQGPQNASFLNPQVNNPLTSTRAGVSKLGTAEQAHQEFTQNPRDGISSSSSSSMRWEPVKQADGSIHKNAAIVSLPRTSTAGVKIEPPKVSGPSSESSRKESGVGPGSPRNPETVREPLSDLSSAMSQHNSTETSAVSFKNSEPSTSYSDYPPHDEVSRSTVVNAEVGNCENYIGSNSNNNADKQGEIEGIHPLPQVEDDAPPMRSLHLRTSLHANVINEGMGDQENNLSASGPTDFVLESRSESSRGGGAASCSKERGESMGNDGGAFPPEKSDDTKTIEMAGSGSKKDAGLDDKTIKGEDQGSREYADRTKGSFGDSRNGSEPVVFKSSDLKESESIRNVEDSVKSTLGQHEVIGKVDDSAISTFPIVEGTASKPVRGTVDLSPGSHGDNVSSSCTPESGVGKIIYIEVADSADNSSPKPQEKARTDIDAKEKSAIKGGSMQILGSSHKAVPELNNSKSMKGKKNRKEFLEKADAAGPTSDLYVAYKGPEEKKEITMSSKSVHTASPRASSNLELADTRPKTAVPDEDGDEIKAEPDDWEDVVESTANGKAVDHREGDGCIVKKYSRDFLLKFANQYTSIPEHFDLTPDIAEAITTGVNGSRSVGRDHHPSPGRSSAGPRMDRRGSGVREDDRWIKVPGAFASGQDLCLALGSGGNVGVRPGQGANYGVLRNPRAQSPVHYAGGILPGLMQPPGSQGGTHRTGSDSDKWQRATGFQQKGLIPSPQTPLQMMHRAEKKYEVGKVTHEEESKQRQLKAILNKLTPQNFEKLFEKVISVKIDNAITLKGLISQIFDKALMEPTFCEMYASLCSHLSQSLPDFNEGDERITFKRLLLNKCQEEFERGEREQEEANKLEEEGEVKQSQGEREEKRMKARRRMLGNIRLIGELYKKRMLTEKIMHECMKKLLGQSETPDEEDLEALCKLMSTIGEMIDHPKAKSHMDTYFERMNLLSDSSSLSSRVRFMLKDAIDLRKNKWQQRRKVEGPKKIEEVHRDAAQERHSLGGRVARSPGIHSLRRGQQMESSPRVNPSSSPNVQVGGFRNLPSQTRGYGGQDVRFEERQPYEPRTLSVPLSQKSGGDDAITLGPQGGLGRGLSVRGSSSVLGTSLSDLSSSAVDSRRNLAGLNGFNSVDRTNSYSSREDSNMRSAADRYRGHVMQDKPNLQGGEDVRSPRHSSDRPASAPSYSKGSDQAFTLNTSEKVWPEKKLQDMSILAIREYCSAKDEKEVVRCIRELNSLSFYPSMVSLWVTDSFERKDKERDLLTELLVYLSKPQVGMLNEGQLIKGFESVLSTLEDAVNDAPKAPEFLGRIFGKVIVENVIPLSEVGRMLHEGGEKRGQLLEAGLAADVLGCTLEAIQSYRGEAALNEILGSFPLRLEAFRPPDPIVSRMLEKFI